MNLEMFLFWLFAFITCGAAILVVASQNVVRMAFWLVISLGSVSALFFLLHADFLGAAQLLIYVGGTVVVLVFGVMLTASGPYLKIQTSAGEQLLGGAVGLAVFALLITSVCATDWWKVSSHVGLAPYQQQATRRGVSAAEDAAFQQGNTSRNLGMSFLGLRPDRDLEPGAKLKMAPGYLLPFEIISVHLLVVLVGAAYLARTKRRAISEPEGSSF
jgi:NADH:ubiquinone oxidoreductase subunit 6 (subunit J)